MKIFISYRRDDSAGYAGRLFDYLTARFGEENVFMDISAIEPGEDFRKVIKGAVGTCDVVLVMIGKQWLNIIDERGQRRLDDPHDWLRMEIANALANPQVRVIPVLVRDAPMPDADELPDDLKELPFRNAFELSDSRFQHDANVLIKMIERFAKELGGKKPPPDPQQKRSTAGFWRIGLGIVALGLIIGMVSYGIRKLGPSSTLTPVATFSSTNVPASTWTPSPASPTWTPSPASPTWTPSLGPSPTFTPIPVNLLSPEIQALDQYYKYINNAGRSDDLSKAWDLLTRKFQCSSSQDCKFVHYTEWWWPRKVQYKLYDCDSTAVDTELRYYGRDQIAATPTAPVYVRYWLVKDHGQLKINSGTIIESPGADCKLVVSVE